MRHPLFSCVIPVKGARPYLADALASLSSQGLGGDLEIIIQDGDVDPDKGQSDALNRGFAKAHGDWLFWLNADDILLPNALKRVRDYILQNTAAKWIAGNELFIDGDGYVLSCAVGPKGRMCLYRHAMPHVYGPSSFFRRELFECVGGCDVALKYCMDWDLWIKFSKLNVVPERMTAYLWAQRRWNGSKTQRVLDAVEAVSQWDEINRMLDQNGLQCTMWGTRTMRLWRLLCGCYWREWIDGLRLKGRRLGAVEASFLKKG